MTQQPKQNNAIVEQLIQQMETVIKGKRSQIILVVACLLAKGHVLLEDMPGTGKTVLAKALAQSLSGDNIQDAVFKRIQFTPDLLPMDLIGAHIFDDSTKSFIFKKGPIFTNILLADEINRASPKVQSALLEVMAEQQVTVGEQTLPLDHVFFTIATQNPIEQEGTYALPEAQLDRFALKISLGYVDESAELDILSNYRTINTNLKDLKPILSLDTLVYLQQSVADVYVHPALVKSVAHIIRGTRTHGQIHLGVSTRGGIALISVMKAFAFIQGRNFVIEDDLMSLLKPALAHRIIGKRNASVSEILDDILEKELKSLIQVNFEA